MEGSSLRGRLLVMREFFGTLMLAALLAGCAAPPAEGCHESTLSRLYLGRGSPHGDVADALWEAFVSDTVAVQFPEGFTVYDARGQWRADNGSVQHEPTRVLEVVHDDTAAARTRVAL